jgi:hypothetical protein
MRCRPFAVGPGWPGLVVILAVQRMIESAGKASSLSPEVTAAPPRAQTA